MKFTKNLKFALRAIFMQANNISTDKGTLLYDGELAVGTEVFVEVVDEDGNVEYVAPENGEYTLEDGRILVITDGKIEEIKEPEVEVEEMSANPAMTVEDVQEPAAEPVEEPTVEPNTLEERIAALESQVAQFTEGIEKIVNLVSGFETRVAEIEEKVAKLDETPAAEPVEEEVAQSKNILSYLK